MTNFTELTAKKGMIHYKSGHGKLDFDYAFIKDILYDGEITLDELLNKIVEEYDEKQSELVSNLSEKFDSYKQETDKKILKLEKALEESLKGLITR